MKKLFITLLIMLMIFSVCCLVLGGLLIDARSDRDELREEVAWLYKAGERVDSLNTMLRVNLRNCSDMLEVFIPRDTTKRLIRARHVPGLDTMPVIESCSLWIRSGR